MLSVILVDDERHALKNLASTICRYAPHLDIVGACTDPHEAVTLINERRPDAVFLDIEMPGFDGFQMLESLTYRSFFPIFCTAYSQYGIQALRANALDYLLKPVDGEELQRAVSKMLERSHIRLADVEQSVRSLFENRSASGKIPLPTASNILYVQEDQLALVEGDHKYSTVQLTNGQTHHVDMSLGDYDQLLCSTGRPFMRVHKSFLVNLNQVWRYIKSDGTLVVNPGRFVPLSKLKRDEVFAALNIPIGLGN